MATVDGTGDANRDAHAESEPGSADGTTDDPIASRIGEWQTRLLQLNRRNNLLYFKPGRSAVGITGFGPDELYDRLRRSRRGLEFPYAPPPRRRGRFAQEDEPEEEPTAPVSSRSDLTTDCEVVDLQRRLRNLRRRDREWEEEQGLNVLFLAVGFLDWIDADGEPARSPLVLIPCDLERASPRDPFRLRAEDADPVVNPTLSHQLSILGFDLPPLDGDSSEEESLDAYVAAVGDRVKSRGDWSVDAGIALGAFSYSKLAMYQDLERMLRQGVRSDLTQLLASGGAARSERTTASGAAPATVRGEDLAGGRLEDLLDIRDQYAVLPTDFSQLGALDQARKGGHLVIHGPPGTGKSQTIANLIATLLADGKRVLFVSEKTAALDVVKQRLEECGLGVFCFDLHSDRGRKSEVYAQLRESVNDPRARIAAGVSADELKEQRDRLNRVVRRLHERRQPLGLSVYEVQGRFAGLRHLPRFEALKAPSVADLEQEWIRQAEADAGRIARRPAEFLSHDASPWMPLRTPQRSLELADLIRHDMADVLQAVEEFRAAAQPRAEWLGVRAIGSAEDARAVARLFELLAEAPAVPGAWLEPGTVPRLRRLSREQAEQQRERRRLEGVLSDALCAEPPSIDYRAVLSRIPLSPGDQEALEATAGRGWRSALATDPSALLDEASDLAAALDRLAAGAAAIAEPLGNPELRTLSRIDHAARLAQRMLALDPVPQHWLTATAIDELEEEVAQARSLLDQLGSEEDALRADFSDGLVELVDEEMLVRYRTDHQSFWRRLFRGEYRSDQRVLRGQLAAPRKLSPVESLTAVERALNVQRLRARWSEIESELSETLGARFRGRETQWERVGEDSRLLRGVLTDWRGEPSILRELTAAGTDGERRHELELASELLNDAPARYRRAVEAIGHEPLGDAQLDVAATGEAVRRALEPLHRISDATAELFRSLVKPLADYYALMGLVESGVRLMAIRDEDERLAPALASDFGTLFAHETTGWAAVSRALDWTEGFLRAANGRVSDTLRQHVTDPQGDGEYTARAHILIEACGHYGEALRRLDQRFDIAATDWASWDAPPLRDIEAWAAGLRENAGDAPAWVEYRDAVRGFDARFGEGAATAVRSLTESAADVPGIVARRVYEAWLDEVYAAEPELGEFNRVDHEEVRARFRELDEQFPTAARQRVRELALRRYLEYARNPLTALDATVTGTGEPESPFEEAVLAALRGRGHRVHAQVGVSGYRIDLAILSQDGAGYDLGIECDGATYHRSPAARDRDWLRQKVLEGLHWRIHRVWSTAWIRDQESEIAAIEEALERARAGVAAEPHPPPAADTANDVPEEAAPARGPVGEREPAIEARAIDGPAPIETELFFDDYRRSYGELWDGDALDIPLAALAARVRHLVEVEQPVHIDAVVDGLRVVLGVRRVGARIRTHIERAISTAISGNALSRDGEFLQVAEEAGTAPRPRYDPDRPIGRVADTELDEGLLLVVRRTFGASPSDLVRETRRQFGWGKTTPNIRDRLTGRIDSLLESARLRRRGDTLVVPE